MESSILPAISTVGFPIVAYLLMWKLAKDTIREQTAATKDLKSEVNQMRNELSRLNNE